MFCPRCGAENADSSFNCASCGWPLRPATDSMAVFGGDSRPQDEPGMPAPPVPGRARAWRSSANLMLAAEVLAALAAVLLFTSFVLFIYYYESVMDPNRDFGELMRLENVVKAMEYSSAFGELIALLALVLVVGGVILTGSAPIADYLARSKLSGVLGLGILMTALICVAAVSTVLLYEGGFYGDGFQRLLARLTLYIPSLVAALVVVLFTVVTDGLRRGVLNTMSDRLRSQTTEGPPPWKP